MSKGDSGRFNGTLGSPRRAEGERSAANFPANPSQIRHMFADRDGHLADSPATRERVKELVNRAEHYLGRDKWGNEWYAQIDAEGHQLWAVVRDGTIQNCGLNAVPRQWDPQTGLSRNIGGVNQFKR